MNEDNERIELQRILLQGRVQTKDLLSEEVSKSINKYLNEHGPNIAYSPKIVYVPEILVDEANVMFKAIGKPNVVVRSLEEMESVFSGDENE